MAYQTKQQQAVLRCLQLRAEECLSAADLSEELRHSGLTVGLATVYRCKNSKNKPFTASWTS